MTDNRTMVEMLRAPTEGCAEAIVVPLILVEQFELKHSLINMITSEQFSGLEKENPHDHIWAARQRLEKKPPRSITTWDDLISKFINEFFPPPRTTNIRNEISNFPQKFDESFHEAWERYKISFGQPAGGLKKPPRSITTWDDLVSKFINEFFPPSRTTNLRNEISNFQQKFDESFHEAWERYKDLLRACPHHGLTKLHQLDTFYNALNPADQDSLNAAAG
nr:hypothetical protein [Tanacetum cinerariifolium]